MTDAERRRIAVEAYEAGFAFGVRTMQRAHSLAAELELKPAGPVPDLGVPGEQSAAPATPTAQEPAPAAMSLCPLCGKDCKNRGGLANHKKWCTGPGRLNPAATTFSCGVCKPVQSFPTNETFIGHNLRCHPAPAVAHFVR